MIENKIIVSICCITYNHVLYIRKCLDGFLMQNTDFAIEILIHDDASTDGTADIIREYEQKYPNIVKPIYQTENQYSKGIKISPTYQFPRVQGKYIAFCEGDDYWTDPYKLQRQVDFMEANPEYSLVYHRVNELWQQSNIIKPETLNESKEELTYTSLDLAKGNCIHTPSVLLRKDSLDIVKLASSSKIIDYYIWMLCTKKGNIKYLPEIMAVYRISENSMWALRDVNFTVSYWLIMLMQLLNEFKDDRDVFSEMFFQLKFYFKDFYNRCKTNHNKKLLDTITKELLIKSYDFQNWWFIYMLHLKVNRLYRLKYYFYLIKKRSINSIWLIKKCLYGFVLLIGLYL